MAEEKKAKEEFGYDPEKDKKEQSDQADFDFAEDLVRDRIKNARKEREGQHTNNGVQRNSKDKRKPVKQYPEQENKEEPKEQEENIKADEKGREMPEDDMPRHFRNEDSEKDEKADKAEDRPKEKEADKEKAPEEKASEEKKPEEEKPEKQKFSGRDAQTEEKKASSITEKKEPEKKPEKPDAVAEKYGYNGPVKKPEQSDEQEIERVRDTRYTVQVKQPVKAAEPPQNPEPQNVAPKEVREELQAARTRGTREADRDIPKQESAAATRERDGSTSAAEARSRGEEQRSEERQSAERQTEQKTEQKTVAESQKSVKSTEKATKGAAKAQKESAFVEKKQSAAIAKQKPALNHRNQTEKKLKVLRGKNTGKYTTNKAAHGANIKTAQETAKQSVRTAKKTAEAVKKSAEAAKKAAQAASTAASAATGPGVVVKVAVDAANSARKKAQGRVKKDLEGKKQEHKSKDALSALSNPLVRQTIPWILILALLVVTSTAGSNAATSSYVPTMAHKYVTEETAANGTLVEDTGEDDPYATGDELIKMLAKYVQKYGPQYNINPNCYSAIIAQGILESGWNSTELSRTHHNFFGMTYDGEGDSANYSNALGANIKWKSFASVEDGIKGYFDFIDHANYSNLKTATDAESYVSYIVEDGYCGDAGYFETVMDVIHANNLDTYNAGASSFAEVYDKEEAKDVAKDEDAPTVAVTALSKINERLNQYKKSVLYSEAANPTSSQKRSLEDGKIVIVLDPGHVAEKYCDEGQTQGPESVTKSGTYECDLTLAYAEAINAELQSRGYENVYLTRDTSNVKLNNIKRASMYNSKNADATIHLHFSSSTETRKDGFDVICPAADSEFEKDAVMDSFLLSQNVANSYKSATGAHIVPGTESGIIRAYGVGSKKAPDGAALYHEFASCSSPQAYMELGYMTNKAEDEKLESEEYKEKAAKGICDGIEQYLLATGRITKVSSNGTINAAAKGDAEKTQADKSDKQAAEGNTGSSHVDGVKVEYVAASENYKEPRDLESIPCYKATLNGSPITLTGSPADFAVSHTYSGISNTGETASETVALPLNSVNVDFVYESSDGKKCNLTNLFQTILAMATVATENDDSSDEAYYNYCRTVVDNAVSRYKGYEVAFTESTVSGTAGNTGGYTITGDDGSVVRVDGASLKASIKIYVDCNFDDLTQFDRYTGWDATEKEWALSYLNLTKSEYEQLFNLKFKKNAAVAPFEGIEKTAYMYLREKGLGDVQIAAIMGNIWAESMWDPAAQNDIKASGLCQWYAGRFTRLQQLAASEGLDWTDVGVQLELLYTEYTEGFGTDWYSKEAFDAATDVHDAVAIWARGYEIFATPPTMDGMKALTESAANGTMDSSGSKAEKYLEQIQNSGFSGEITYYSQWEDGRWSGLPYAFGTVGDSGCGLTSFAMIANVFSGEEVTPADVQAYWSSTFPQSYSTVSTHSIFKDFAEHFRMQAPQLDVHMTPDDLKQALADGKGVIIDTAAGSGSRYQTSGGHYILAYGIGPNDNPIIYDPGNSQNYQDSLNGDSSYSEALMGQLSCQVFTAG